MTSFLLEKRMIVCGVCYCGLESTLQSHKKRHHSKQVLLSPTGNLGHEKGFHLNKYTTPCDPKKDRWV